MNERVEINCLVEPKAESEESHIQIKMVGSATGLLAALEQISVNVLKTIEESYDEGFTVAAYTFMQKRIVDGVPALKSDFDKFDKKLSPLMSILGKTFHMGGDE